MKMTWTSCFLQFVGRSGDGFLIGIVVLPVADGNAQAPADAGDAVLLEDVQADFLVDGMHGQDGIGRHVDRWPGHAHGSQFSLGISIADADDGDALQDLAHGPAGFGTADGTDTLGIEHDRLLEEQGYFHDPQVIIEAAGTGHVLQEAATAAYENITAANSRCDSEEVQAVYSLYVMVSRVMRQLPVMTVMDTSGMMSFREPTMAASMASSPALAKP